MKSHKQFIAFLLTMVFIFSSFLLVSCDGAFGKRKFEAVEFRYFDTKCILTGYETDRKSFDEVRSLVFSMLEEYHKLYDIRNHYDGVTNLYDLNELHNGVHSRLACDERIIDLLLFAKEAYALTGGATNIAMGSVLTHWQRAIDEYKDFGFCNLPERKTLEEAALHTDIDAIVIDEAAGTVFISDPKVKIDVGAVAKGYAVEMIARELELRGLEGYLLDFGGNVRAVGKKPSGEEWLVGIEDPIDTSGSPFLEILSLKREALVTSGSYRTGRFLIHEGVKYHHIIDERTLYPANYYVSVSVVSENSAIADALSTALFCLPPDEAMALAESIDGIEAIFLDNEGNISSTQGFSDYVQDKK